MLFDWGVQKILKAAYNNNGPLFYVESEDKYTEVDYQRGKRAIYCDNMLYLSIFED